MLKSADVSAEVIATDFEGMVREGEALAALHPRIVVKLPCTAAGIRAVKYFAAKDIRTNCTLVFSVGQALLAAKAGAEAMWLDTQGNLTQTPLFSQYLAG